MFLFTIHNAEKSDDLDTRLQTLITGEGMVCELP